MPERRIEVSPQLYARIGGALYLIIIVIGLFGEMFVRDRLIVAGDAAATAANIQSPEGLCRFRAGSARVLLIGAVAMLLAVYVLRRPVCAGVALLAAFFNLISIGIEAASVMYLIQPVFALSGAPYLKAFSQ